MKYLTPGTLAGALGFAAVIAGAFGKPALAAFFADPSTASEILALVGAGSALAAGALEGVGVKA